MKQTEVSLPDIFVISMPIFLFILAQLLPSPWAEAFMILGVLGAIVAAIVGYTRIKEYYSIRLPLLGQNFQQVGSSLIMNIWYEKPHNGRQVKITDIEIIWVTPEKQLYKENVIIGTPILLSPPNEKYHQFVSYSDNPLGEIAKVVLIDSYDRKYIDWRMKKIVLYRLILRKWLNEKLQ